MNFCGILLAIAVTANAQYTYAALRIVVRDSTHIDSLIMNISQDTILRVQGRRSNDSIWEYVVAKWEISPGLNIVPPAPAGASTWIFSPVDPGSSGWIRVTEGNDAVIRPDTIFVNVTSCCGPALIRLDIITPPEKRVAGDTSVFAVIGVYDKDGPVRGVYCDSMILEDIIGSRQNQPQPYAVVANDKIPFGNKFNVCFNDGLDTIKFVLFNAPSSPDSLHQITVYWKGLSAQSAPFYVYPSTIRHLELQRLSDSTSLDSVFLPYPWGNIALACVGYDAFGNKRGLENANWTTTGTLHAITKPDSISRIYYEAANVISEEEGYIYCSPVSDSTIRDSVKIRIEGPSGVILKNRASQAHNLRVMMQNSGAYVFPLPGDVAHSTLFFTLYSLSGRVVFKTEVADAGKPISVNTSVLPGIYLVSLRTGEHQLVKGRFFVLK
jgi:hypothetical protein